MGYDEVEMFGYMEKKKWNGGWCGAVERVVLDVVGKRKVRMG